MTLGENDVELSAAAAVPAPVATVAPDDPAVPGSAVIASVVTGGVQLAEGLGRAVASALDVVAFGPRVEP
jgi:hypothetical protein